MITTGTFWSSSVEWWRFDWVLVTRKYNHVTASCFLFFVRLISVHSSISLGDPRSCQSANPDINVCTCPFIFLSWTTPSHRIRRFSYHVVSWSCHACTPGPFMNERMKNARRCYSMQQNVHIQNTPQSLGKTKARAGGFYLSM